jgi:hypothetical protein
VAGEEIALAREEEVADCLRDTAAGAEWGVASFNVAEVFVEADVRST